MQKVCERNYIFMRRSGSLAWLMAVAVVQHATAQPWPQRAVRLVVPNAPGGGSDTVARVLAERLSPALGQPMVVENRAGAGGRQAAEFVAKSLADGHTLLLGTGATLITARALYGRLGYDPEKSFAPVALLAHSAYLLVVHPAVPAASVRQLVALAKRRNETRADGLNYASSGAGSPSHLAAEMFRFMAAVQLNHVPYKGSAPGTLSVMQGETDLMFSNYVTALPHVNMHRFRALGVSTLQRSALAPQTPTIAESGLPGFEVLQFYSVAAPAGTHDAIIRRLNDDIVKRFPSDETRRLLAAQGAEIRTSTPVELAALHTRETAKWNIVIKQAGIQPE
jgi:tripartite-type tricarboxylate transporter receptor subunit TctC